MFVLFMIVAAADSDSVNPVTNEEIQSQFDQLAKEVEQLKEENIELQQKLDAKELDPKGGSIYLKHNLSQIY